MRSIVLGCIVFIFIGCGSSNNNKGEEPLVETDKTKPISPVTKDSEKTPPSIPII